MGWDRGAVRFQAEDLLPVLFPGVERLSFKVGQGKGSGDIFDTISAFKTECDPRFMSLAQLVYRDVKR